MKAVNADAQSAALAAAGNAGLMFERIGSNWVGTPSGNPERRVPDRSDWIKTAAGVRGAATDLAAYAERLATLALRHGGVVGRFTATSRLAIGLGVANPIENGLIWHRTLGVPYIPGSSVKGMIQAYAQEWADDAEPSDAADLPSWRDRRVRIFGQDRHLDGTAATPDQIQLGSVEFLDAVPTGPVRIVADIITPHVGVTRPSETLPLKPISFAAMEAGAVFQFAAMPSSRFLGSQCCLYDPLDEAMSDCALVRRWLDEALRITGAGAKTKAGYGRFAPAG